MPRTVPFATLALVLSILVPTRARALDLTEWNGLLGKYVDSTGMVRYRQWKADGTQGLDRFLAALAQTRPETFPRTQDRLAFWINAYNACVIKGVLNRYPLASVTQDGRFFKEAAYTVAGQAVSLDAIENEKIRPVFKDSRVHMALVCAAKSCPRLLPRAYTGVEIEAMLDGNSQDFLATPGKNSFDPPSRTAKVSMIFKWFDGDFRGSHGSVLGFLKKYAPAGAQEMLGRPDLRLENLTYDWALNDRP